MATTTDHSHSSSHSKTTTDHAEIKKWVDQHGGKPSEVKGTERKEGETGLLRIEFPKGPGDDSKLEEIGWDEFFKKFDESKLAFLYQEETADGKTSRFCKLVSRDSESSSHSASHSAAHTHKQ